MRDATASRTFLWFIGRKSLFLVKNSGRLRTAIHSFAARFEERGARVATGGLACRLPSYLHVGPIAARSDDVWGEPIVAVRPEHRLLSIVRSSANTLHLRSSLSPWTSQRLFQHAAAVAGASSPAPSRVGNSLRRVANLLRSESKLGARPLPCAAEWKLAERVSHYDTGVMRLAKGARFAPVG